MPIFITALWGFLLNIMGSLVGKVLLALGMSYVAYSGFDTAITWILNEIKNGFSGMPADIVSFLAWLWVDRAISMVFSAYTVAMTFKLAGGTVLKKLVMK